MQEAGDVFEPRSGLMAVPIATDLAGPYVPGLLMTILQSHSHEPPVRIDPIDGTMLFVDISGFTALSERLAQRGREGAEILTSVINRFFEGMLGIAKALGGDNLKFGGDALLLLFRDEGHASRAVAAGHQMMRATRNVPAMRFGHDFVKLGMSAGAHTGRFWSALVGIDGTRMQLCLLGGDASRLAQAEGSAATGELLVTPECWAMIERDFAGVARGPFVLVKRRKRSLPAWDSLSPASDGAKYLPAAAASYIPPPVLDMARAGNLAHVEGEHRRVTTVFISLRGANSMLDGGDSARALDEVNQYVTAAVALAAQHGGFLVSTDVDTHGLKLIFIFGAPVGREHPARDAFRLALGLSNKLDALDLELSHRVGINSGYVFCGDLGASFRRDYTVLGDAVNLSARLMAAAADGQILVSESVAHEAGPRFVTSVLDPIRVKGKSAPIAVHVLVGEAPGVEATSEELPMLGRDTEFESLAARARDVMQSSGALAMVVGAPGSGKSRLVSELEKTLTDHGWEALRGACFRHSAGAPYGSWIAILHRLFGIDGVAGALARTEVVRRLLRLAAPEHLEWAVLLNGLIDVEFAGGNLLSSIDEQARRARLHDIIVAVLAHRCANQPVLLVLEDIQWADEASIQLTDSVVAGLKGMRALVCLTARDDSVPEISVPHGSLRIALQQLTDEQSLALLHQLAPSVRLDPESQSDLLTKCRGNPLFLEEVGRSLRDEGASVTVPDRLQLLLQSNIDSLPSAARRGLRLAAVIGTSFDLELLSELAEQSDEHFNVPLALDQLTQAKVIQTADAARNVYSFRQSMMRDVAYESLLFARRRELHHRVALSIESLYSDGIEAHYETLADHFEQGRDLPKTIEYSVLAGDRARRVFASESAIGFYHRALEATQHAGAGWLEGSSLIEERIADSLEVKGQYSDAVEAYRRSLRAWLHRPVARSDTHLSLFELGSRQRAARESSLETKLAVALERSSDYAGSLRWLDRALLSIPSRNAELEARIHGARSVAHSRLGAPGEALREGQTALAAARRSGRPEQRAYAHQVVATAYYELGQLRASVRHRQASLRLYEEAGDLSRILAAHGNLGLSYQEIGEIPRAIEHHQACLDTARRLGNTVAVAIASNNLGEALLIRGDAEAARSELQRTVDIFHEHGQPLAPAGLALVNIARADVLLGALDEADVALREGTDLLRSAGARGLLLQAQAQRAELAFEQRDIDGAARTATKVAAEAREHGAELTLVRAERTLGRVAAMRANPDEAMAKFEEAIGIAERLEAEYELGLSLLEAARVGAQYHRAGWRRLARRAARSFQRLGAERLQHEAQTIPGRAKSA